MELRSGFAYIIREQMEPSSGWCLFAYNEQEIKKARGMSRDGAGVPCDLVPGLDLRVERGMVPDDFGVVIAQKFRTN